VGGDIDAMSPVIIADALAVRRQWTVLAGSLAESHGFRWRNRAGNEPIRPLSFRANAMVLPPLCVRAINSVFGHLLTRRLERFGRPFPDTVNI